ncbi:hypothetical protein EKL97_03985 [Flavobacterium sp. LS1P28]|uniref:hypothetical protein n=1 Tax=Flavobacterium sp. LS1P28 TaxID=2497752 RepID=UPI000F81B257|nr:hypothetical protein [Flavobacterium sp. LS1P28]RTY83450.1 hypothetical protein EKL97_03985 [Flavobacterium sp. LS1P28]
MTIHQAEPLALSTGMPASEFTKLRVCLIVPLSKKPEKAPLTTDTTNLILQKERSQDVKNFIVNWRENSDLLY